MRDKYPAWPFADLNALEKELPQIAAFGKRWKNKFPFIVVVGLGGAILGTQAIVEALLPFPQKTKVHFLRNLDPLLFEKIFSWIDIKKTLFIVVSKSGETLETNVLFDIIVQKLYSVRRNPGKNMIVVTEERESPLYKKARKRNILFYPHPKNIGGRYSVLTAVSLLPAYILGLPIKDFYSGAQKVSLKKAQKLAFSIYRFLKQKKQTMVLFPYSLRLLRFCDWLTQLIAESLGKNGKGITPITAVGPKDQHSLLQLFLDGPKDKWFLFMSHDETFSDSALKKISHTQKMEKIGVQKIFRRRKIPFLEYDLQKLDAKNIGNLFFFFELVTTHLGSLLGVNPFNQPAIEEAKKSIKALL